MLTRWLTDYTYLWSNGQTENPINLSLNPGIYSVEVTDENFCNEDTVFHIAVMSSDCIPNVFSPNNDGSNDVWNLEDAFFYLDSEVRVYNRYGKLVFKLFAVKKSKQCPQHQNLKSSAVYF